jgi:putative membrane protein
MSRITFRRVILVSSLLALALSFNLLVGAQDQTPTGSSTKQTSKDKQDATKQKSNTTDMQHDHATNKGMATGTGALSNDDKKFVMEAAHGGMMEVELGKLATQKAMSDDVKQFGQRMVDDHSKANDELMQLASSKGIMMNHSMGSDSTTSGTGSQTSGSQMSGSTAQSSSSNTQSSGSTAQSSGSNTMSGQGSNASGDDAKMMKKHQEMVSKLSALSGAEFDRKYMEHMVKDHEKDVAAFERESTKGSDADLKAWAAKTLPTLREHLQMARDTQMKVKGNSKGSMNKSSSTSGGSRMK